MFSHEFVLLFSQFYLFLMFCLFNLLIVIYNYLLVVLLYLFMWGFVWVVAEYSGRNVGVIVHKTTPGSVFQTRNVTPVIVVCFDIAVCPFLLQKRASSSICEFWRAMMPKSDP